MSDIKIVIGADVGQATAGLKTVQTELGKTAAVSGAAQSAFKGVGSQISSLGQSLISGGILTGIALLGAGFIKLAQDAFGLTEEQQRLNDVLTEAKGAYVKATLEVDKMKIAFEQAKSGVITKEEALKLYNSTIGKTIGNTKDLDEAERNFTAQAENYIRFTLLKAAANIALGKAAEAAFKAEQERIEGPKKAGILDRLGAGRLGGPTPEMLQQKRINDAIKEENNFKKIALALQEKAKQFGFDYNSILEKDVKLQKEKVQVLKKQVEIKPVDPRIYANSLRNLFKDIEDKEFKLKINVNVQPEFKVDAAGINKEAYKLADDINAVIQNAFVDTFAGLGQAIGDAMSGVSLSGAFDGIIKSLAGGLKQIGQMIIQTNVQLAILKKVGFSNPVVGIAVGIAITALGTLLQNSIGKTKAFATGVRNFQGGFATVGERGPETVFLPRGSSVQPNNEMLAYGGGASVFIPSITLAGSDLVIAFNRASARMDRNN